jgi:hypothetical protein
MLFALNVTDSVTDPEVVKRVAAAVVIFFCTTALSFVVGRWWGKYLARRQWERKQFLGRIIVSLNTFADGWLKIRTIFEKSLEEVFLIPVAVEKVRQASSRTTQGNAILPIEDPKDRWFLLNFVLNAVAERFCDGLVRHDAGQPVKVVPYVLFLTCEQVGPDRIRKVRAMMIQKEHLLSFPYGGAGSAPQVEHPWHLDRVKTLRQAAEQYRKELEEYKSVPEHSNFMLLEICI